MKYCNYCHAYKESWADHPSYRSEATWQRYKRCWDCDKWTLCDCHHGCCNHGTYEALRRAEDRNSSLSSQNSSLQNQLTQYSNDLTNTQSRLREKEGQLTTTTNQLTELRGLFNDLRIESSNKDRDIESKERDIKNLEVELFKSKDEILEYKIGEQERELNEFIQQLRISRESSRELRNAYQRLIRSRENYNQDNIDRAESEIEKIKDELLKNGWLRRGISIENVQKLCSKCKDFANLKIKQSKIQEQQWRQEQQQYEARQEQQTNNN